MTRSLQQYEQTARQLLQQPALLSALRDHLRRSRLSAFVFDTDSQVADLSCSDVCLLIIHIVIGDDVRRNASLAVGCASERTLAPTSRSAAWTQATRHAHCTASTVRRTADVMMSVFEV